MMKKKLISLLLASTLTLSIFSGCGSSNEKANDNSASNSTQNGAAEVTTYDDVTIRIGVQATDYIQYLEEEYGVFADAFSKLGVEVEFNSFESGPSITEALASDSLDIGFLGELPVLSAASAGNPIRIIGSGAESLNGIAIVVPEGSNITSLEDLEGKTVAYTVGSAGHAFIVKALESVGLGETDIEGLNVANPNIEATLLSGDVDAVVTVGPFIYKIENENEGHILVDNSDIYTPVSAIIAGNAFLENYPELATEFLSVWHDLNEYANDNRDEVEQVLAERQDTDLEYFKRFEVIFDDSWSDTLTQTLKDTENFLINHDLIAQEIDPETVLDLSYQPQ